jgi:hypothetical protein
MLSREFADVYAKLVSTERKDVILSFIAKKISHKPAPSADKGKNNMIKPACIKNVLFCKENIIKELQHGR